MATLTEVSLCFFLSCKANARVKPAKDEAWPAFFLIFVLLYVLFVLCHSLYCLCVYVYCTYYCHQTQLQLNIYIISYCDN